MDAIGLLVAACLTVGAFACGIWIGRGHTGPPRLSYYGRRQQTGVAVRQQLFRDRAE